MLLILSFTDIAHDARVKKQALLFAERYTVVTCGYGDPVRDDIEHISLSVPSHAVKKYIEPFWVRTKCYGFAFHADERSKHAINALRGRSFDACIANELETLAVAYRVVGPKRTLLDLHEYYPGLRDDMPLWVRVRKPYQVWLMRTKAPLARAVTTVSDTIATRYFDEFGVRCGVVRNAAPYRPDLRPGPVGDPIRLVHSGVAAPNRRPEVMMRAVAEAKTNITLDLFLTQQQTPFGAELRALADSLGERVRVHPPVPHEELVGVLNQFDLGLHILAPTNTNNSLALPNKFFDFTQARLGMLIGPTKDMVTLLETYELGIAANGFSIEEVVEALNRLTSEQVARWKKNAHENAHELSAEQQQTPWLEGVARLID
ncbi:glycosyltransferase family 1 protein [Leucobacter chinensis]|uniref:glycosyltransferase family 1 protein n=1 Tax=Leucobacter chinensis TaxID=2851010 RepID=UPI001C227518|nr:glycosyltransferase family 1 protein [Leucobacter chinensis]